MIDNIYANDNSNVEDIRQQLAVELSRHIRNKSIVLSDDIMLALNISLNESYDQTLEPVCSNNRNLNDDLLIPPNRIRIREYVNRSYPGKIVRDGGTFASQHMYINMNKTWSIQILTEDEALHEAAYVKYTFSDDFHIAIMKWHRESWTLSEKIECIFSSDLIVANILLKVAEIFDIRSDDDCDESQVAVSSTDVETADLSSTDTTPVYSNSATTGVQSDISSVLESMETGRSADISSTTMDSSSSSSSNSTSVNTVNHTITSSSGLNSIKINSISDDRFKVLKNMMMMVVKGYSKPHLCEFENPSMLNRHSNVNWISCSNPLHVNKTLQQLTNNYSIDLRIKHGDLIIVQDTREPLKALTPEDILSLEYVATANSSTYNTYNNNYSSSFHTNYVSNNNGNSITNYSNYGKSVSSIDKLFPSNNSIMHNVNSGIKIKTHTDRQKELDQVNSSSKNSCSVDNTISYSLDLFSANDSDNKLPQSKDEVEFNKQGGFALFDDLVD